MTGTDWRRIADALAERLRHQIGCDEHATETEGCPFCADGAAYGAYLAAGGTVRPLHVEGESISIWDIKKGPPDA